MSMTVKKLFKLIQIFQQEHTLSNDISTLAELLLSYANFEKEDKYNFTTIKYFDL